MTKDNLIQMIEAAPKNDLPEIFAAVVIEIDRAGYYRESLAGLDPEIFEELWWQIEELER